MSILIVNGRVVTPEAEVVADLLIDGETITAVGRDLPRHGQTVIDASGRWVIPGGVDVHTHLDAPVGGTVSSDDFETGTRAAAFGGTTCIVDFATQRPGEPLGAALSTWRRKAERATIDYGLHMIVVDLPEERTAELREMVEAGVTSFKVFMAYPGVLMIDDAAILRVLREARLLGALVCVHAEDGPTIAGLTAKALAAGYTSPVYHALTRPPETEAEATRRAVLLSEQAGAPLYVVHVSCGMALDEISAARDRGLPVFGETCPHYLLLSANDLARPGQDGAKFVLTPPLRGYPDQEALWKALAAGTLQVVSTDHCPFFFATQKLADTTDFTRIPNGGPGIEHRLELLYHFGVALRKLTVRRWVDLVSTLPSKIFGLFPRKGALAPGSDADVVVWNPRGKRKITAMSQHMRVDYSLYEGIEVTGAAETVIARGKIIVRGPSWLGGKGEGRFIRRAVRGWERLT
jgi:dihydropyrimidinase